jgi:uncharacterized protein (TIGR02449 family)
LLRGLFHKPNPGKIKRIHKDIPMEDLLDRFEKKIKSIAREYEILKQENMHLRGDKLLLVREKGLLLEKNKLAIAQIEKMVSRLRSIEISHE